MSDGGAPGEDLEGVVGERDGPPAQTGGEGSVQVVGTAHVSQDSVDEVEETIERERPDVVAVELDEGRFRQMKGETPDDLDPGDVLSGNTVYQFLAYWLLSYVQKRMGDRFDVDPGADMLAAVETAEGLGIGVALVDRDIQETIQRLWGRMRFREKVRLAGSLVSEMADPLTVGLSIGLFVSFLVTFVAEAVAGPFLLPTGLGAGLGLPLVGGLVGLVVTVVDTVVVALLLGGALGLPIAGALHVIGTPEESYDEIDMERLTDTDVVSAMMEEFRRFTPGGAEALIDERDAYIAHRLVALRSAGYDVVAVVGAGHRDGIERYLANPETLPSLDTLTGSPSGGRWRSILYRAVGYAFTLGFLVFFVLLALGGVQQQWLLGLLAAWFLINGIIAAGLARFAGAHWTSAGAGGAVAWLTSINPLLAPGWFAGYVELRYINVNVTDITRLNEILDDEEAPIGELFARMREVPLFRLIMIVAMTNVGSIIASAAFATILLPAFAGDVGGLSGLANLMLQGAENGARMVWGLLP